MARPASDIRPRLLLAARERFLSDGVEGASLRKICSDAQTSLGMFYYYFKTKDELFFEVVEEIYHGFLEDLEATLAPDAAVEVRLTRFFERLARLSDDEFEILRLVASDALSGSPRLERLLERFKRGHIALALKLLHEGLAQGVFRGDLPLPALFVALMALAGPAQALLRLAGGRFPLAIPKAGMPEALVTVLLDGIRADS